MSRTIFLKDKVLILAVYEIQISNNLLNFFSIGDKCLQVYFWTLNKK